MRKFRIIGSGNILNEGEKTTCTVQKEKNGSILTTKIEGYLEGELLKKMLEDGIIAEIKPEKITIKPKKHKPTLRELMDSNNHHAVLDICIERLQKKMGVSYDELKDVVSKLNKVYPPLNMSMFLRELALMFDETYPKNIRTCETIWYISQADFHIHDIESWRIKEWCAFAAFRTHDDAVFAVNCVNSLCATGSDNDIEK